jgi:hypothetical protein
VANEKKGLVYEAFTDEGVKKLDDELAQYAIEELQDEFKQAYRNAKRLLRAQTSDTSAILSSFTEDEEISVDAIIANELETDQVKLQITKIETIYLAWFGENITD